MATPEAMVVAFGDMVDDFGRMVAVKALCVWWWDWDRPLTGETGRQLREWMGEYMLGEETEPPERELVKALLFLGYPRFEAERRARRPEMTFFYNQTHKLKTRGRKK